MTPDQVSSLVQAVVAVGGTVGTVWFVMRMVVAYQRDFTERYVVRVKDQEQRISLLEAKVEAAHAAVEECRARESSLVSALRAAGVALPSHLS